MRHTPRNAQRSRGIGTLIGNGWLRESPRNYIPREWDRLGRSALKKCMFLPAAPPLLADALPHSPSLPPPTPARRKPNTSHKRNPEHDVRQMPVVDPAMLHGPGDVPRGQRAAAWWEDPVALGALLLLVPPIGLAVLWSSRRYSPDARWALTVMTALTMCLVATVTIVVCQR